MIKVFTLNKNGKIELTEKQLKKLLDDVYQEGYRDNKHYTWSSPMTYPYYYPSTVYYTDSTSTNPYTIAGATTGTIITIGKGDNNEI